MTLYVVGLDGAEPSLLRRWADEGHLPAFARLFESGASGGLETTLPPITFPAWKCYSTGKTPGKLGVYEWFAFDAAGPSIETNDSADFRSREYWDVLADESYRPATVNMPTTHPPNTDDGVLCVAGSPASERETFTKPESLKDDLIDTIPDYRVKPDLVVGEASADELVAEAKELVDQRFDAAEWLVTEKDANPVHFTVFVTDTVQHRLWDRPERLREMYERVDDRLGTLLDDPDATVICMSDHGFTRIETGFYPNQWLAERGDLTLGSDTAKGALAQVGLTRERLKRVVDALGLVNVAQALVPESAQRFFPSESGRTAVQDAPIDWTETKAISLGRGPIYLNDAAFEDESERESYRMDLQSALESLETPEGTPVAEAVHDPETFYSGTCPRGPDLLVEYTEGVDAPESVGGEVFGNNSDWLATHRRTGLFAAAGEGIADADVDLSIYDVAPTLLHLLGEAVPEDVDGDVRFDVLEGEAGERSVEIGPPSGRDAGGERAGEEVEETLRNLGYVE